MNKPAILTVAALVGWLCIAMCPGGCQTNDNPLDPTEVVKAPANDLTLPINISASAADETEDIAPGATVPTPDDLKAVATDYVIGTLDVVDISVLDLFQEGLETVLRRQVTESGNIDLPLLSAPVKAEGLTVDQLRARSCRPTAPTFSRTRPSP